MPGVPAKDDVEGAEETLLFLLPAEGKEDRMLDLPYERKNGFPFNLAVVSLGSVLTLVFFMFEALWLAILINERPNCRLSAVPALCHTCTLVFFTTPLIAAAAALFVAQRAFLMNRLFYELLRRKAVLIVSKVQAMADPLVLLVVLPLILSIGMFIFIDDPLTTIAFVPYYIPFAAFLGAYFQQMNVAEYGEIFTLAEFMSSGEPAMSYLSGCTTIKEAALRDAVPWADQQLADKEDYTLNDKLDKLQERCAWFKDNKEDAWAARNQRLGTFVGVVMNYLAFPGSILLDRKFLQTDARATRFMGWNQVYRVLMCVVGALLLAAAIALIRVELSSSPSVSGRYLQSILAGHLHHVGAKVPELEGGDF
ncbi:unnamed protein product [Vitrella brassicaformis CCMP3155]|uniref:Uncharacterized protein n=1 Tax=Vitrella brassicaformis (strain CCMP3155) TaxID=1169540 RepID=A0A0G4FYA3_VITBC|nr:unnamed protein product [Vitrella brassicaformis CCMP3155]|eukprot:CEM20335.1 unnamed protein product [Vitrella brassicaformis CCMP3155]